MDRNRELTPVLGSALSMVANPNSTSCSAQKALGIDESRVVHDDL
jgi:hypothetical protein